METTNLQSYKNGFNDAEKMLENKLNRLTALEARVKELEAGLKEIDEILHGELPVTRQVKAIARRLLEVK